MTVPFRRQPVQDFDSVEQETLRKRVLAESVFERVYGGRSGLEQQFREMGEALLHLVGRQPSERDKVAQRALDIARPELIGTAYARRIERLVLRVSEDDMRLLVRHFDDEVFRGIMLSTLPGAMGGMPAYEQEETEDLMRRCIGQAEKELGR